MKNKDKLELNFLVKYSDDGRITIPREVRNALNLKGRMDLELHVENNNIVINKQSGVCNICHSKEGVKSYLVNSSLVDICEECKNALVRLNDYKEV